MVFTCCPPGPPDRLYSNRKSRDGITRPGRITSDSSVGAAIQPHTTTSTSNLPLDYRSSAIPPNHFSAEALCRHPQTTLSPARGCEAYCGATLCVESNVCPVRLSLQRSHSRRLNRMGRPLRSFHLTSLHRHVTPNRSGKPLPPSSIVASEHVHPCPTNFTGKVAMRTALPLILLCACGPTSAPWHIRRVRDGPYRGLSSSGPWPGPPIRNRAHGRKQ